MRARGLWYPESRAIATKGRVLYSRSSAKHTMEKQPKLILFADDFKDNRDLYGHFLIASGFRVALASDGEQAVEQALQLQPDVIVMDLSMPVVDGREAA